MRLRNIHIFLMVSATMVSCGGKKSGDEEVEIVEKPTAACKLIFKSDKDLLSDAPDFGFTYSQVCFESKVNLTPGFCESMRPEDGTYPAQFFVMFEDATECPKEDVFAICEDRKVEATVYHYVNDNIETDLEILEKSCTDTENTSFKLVD